MDGRSKVWLVGVLFVFYLFLAATIPVVEDELYYWCWSKDVQWSYYDHPPMTATLIRMSTLLLGDTVLGIRLPACIASAFVVYVLLRLTPHTPLVIGVILTPLFTLFAVVMTPDSPLIFCWAAYLWWLIELHRILTPPTDSDPRNAFASLPTAADALRNPTSQSPNVQFLMSSEANESVYPKISMAWWLIGGILLGCGVLSKYTMGLAVPAGFLTFVVARRRWKDWLPGYMAHGVIAFVVASPILIYNIGQDFEPILFQLRHVAEKTPSPLRSFGDFVGVQILSFGTLPFFLFPMVCYHARRICQNPGLRVCCCLYALPLAFFLYKSTQSRLEANWALVCFISFWPIACEWYQSVPPSAAWRWLTAAAFLPPVVAVLGLTAHLIHPISLVPIKIDRVYCQISVNEAAREVGRKIHERHEPLPVFADTYQWTSLLRFQSLDARQIAGLSRPSHFTRPPRHLTDVKRAYVVNESPLPAKFSEGFGPPELLDSVPITVRGETVSTVQIWLYCKNE